MMSAKIYSPARNIMQSGQAKTGVWVLEFSANSRQHIDPLMGWSGSKGTLKQLKLSFASKEDAIAFAKSKGIDFEVIETLARSRKPNIRKFGYGENFATNRRSPWTH